MGWIELKNKRRINGRLYKTEGKGQYRYDAVMAPLHYESELDSGKFDSDIDLRLDRVEVAGKDLSFYECKKNQFHFRFGDDGWIEFGGRQGEHWLYYRLADIGWLEKEEFTSLGLKPIYNPYQFHQESFARTIGPNSDQVYYRTELNWDRVFSNDNGARADIRYRLDLQHAKEDVIINEALRKLALENIPANNPEFGLLFELDLSDIPEMEDQKNSKFSFKNSDGKELARFDIDNVFSTGTNGKTRANLNKTVFIIEDRYYIFIGLKLKDLQQMADGDLIFDPTTWGATGIADTNDDGHDSSGVWDNDGILNQIYLTGNASAASRSHLGFSWQLPEIADTNTIDEMYLRAYCRSSSGTVTHKLVVEDSDPATATRWGSTHLPRDASWIRANSTQNQAFSSSTWYWGESDTLPTNLASDLQDLLTSYGSIAEDDRINIAVISEDTGSGDYARFEDYSHAGTNEAELTIVYSGTDIIYGSGIGIATASGAADANKDINAAGLGTATASGTAGTNKDISASALGQAVASGAADGTVIGSGKIWASAAGIATASGTGAADVLVYATAVAWATASGVATAAKDVEASALGIATASGTAYAEKTLNYDITAGITVMKQGGQTITFTITEVDDVRDLNAQDMELLDLMVVPQLMREGAMWKILNVTITEASTDTRAKIDELMALNDWFTCYFGYRYYRQTKYIKAFILPPGPKRSYFYGDQLALVKHSFVIMECEK